MSEEQEKQCKTIQRKKNNPLVFPWNTQGDCLFYLSEQIILFRKGISIHH
jgi:hypothetical protein